MHLGMVEVTALEVPLLGVISVGHPLYVLEVLLAIDLAFAGIDLESIEHLLDVLDPISRTGVGSQPFGELPAATGLTHPIQGLEDLAHLPNVVVLIQSVAETGLVGLVLRVSTVLEEQYAEPGAEHLAKLRD